MCMLLTRGVTARIGLSLDLSEGECGPVLLIVSPSINVPADVLSRFGAGLG